MKHWTLKIVSEFELWLEAKGGSIRYPIRELMDGSFELDVNPPKGMTGQEAVDKYDKEVLNA